MAATIVSTRLVKSITGVDEDLDIFGDNIPLESIQFVPGAAADKLVVKEGTAAGAVIYSCLAPAALDGSMYIKNFGGTSHRPVIDFSDCVLSAGHMVLVERR